MKRIISILIVGFLIAMSIRSGWAQIQDTFYFNNNLDRIKSIEVDYTKVPKHYLGYEIGSKMYLLDQTYTVVEEPSPVNPVEKTIVNKPAIFYSIKKLNKYYKKTIKKGEITKEQAKDELNTYLDICLAIYNQETEIFEEALKNSKKEKEIAAVFSRVILE
jgi:hypothetical protein